TSDEIDAFADIYRETMRRVDANSYYFFSNEYFHRFLSASDYKNFLLLAYKEDEITAGAIFTATKTVMQYHLAGTREKFIQEAPMKLVLDEARMLGNEYRLQFLHLGGGVGGSDTDP